jgi:CRP/FNR family cyclic AMP-dependent transcriptional regulator
MDLLAAACESQPMAVSIDHLREVKLLAGLKDADLATLAADLAERRVAAGDPIVGEGTGGVAFFFILEGETSVTVGGDEVATLGRGEYVGELALLDPDGPRSATVTAKTDAVLGAMSAWQFRPFVLAHPEVAWTLLQRLARRLREAQSPVGAGGPR